MSEDKKKCGCGRSTTGFCIGIHKLNNEQYKVHLDHLNRVMEQNKLKEEAKPELLKE